MSPLIVNDQRQNPDSLPPTASLPAGQVFEGADGGIYLKLRTDIYRLPVSGTGERHTYDRVAISPSPVKLLKAWLIIEGEE